MNTSPKRLTKEQLLDIINAFGFKPTINQISLFYENNVKQFNNNLNISPETLRYYIKQYDLEDAINLHKQKI